MLKPLLTSNCIARWFVEYYSINKDWEDLIRRKLFFSVDNQIISVDFILYTHINLKHAEKNLWSLTLKASREEKKKGYIGEDNLFERNKSKYNITRVNINE